MNLLDEVMQGLDVLKKGAAKLDAFALAIEAKSPDFLKVPEEDARKMIADALQAADLASLTVDATKVGEVLKSFGGIVGGGAGPDLVG